jgi:hypothetical protein
MNGVADTLYPYLYQVCHAIEAVCKAFQTCSDGCVLAWRVAYCCNYTVLSP